MNNNWQTKKLGEVCEYISRGVSPKYINEGGILVLNQKCIRNHKVDYAFARMHNVDCRKIDSKKIIKDGDVLINSTGVGTLGRVAQVKNINNVVTVDSHVTIVRPVKDLFHDEYFGYVMIFVEDILKDSGDGASGQIELSRNKLKEEIKIVFTENISEQKRIVKILDEVFENIEKTKENAKKNLQNSRELFESYLQSVFVNHSEKWEEVKFGDEKLLKIIDGDRGKNYPKKSDFFDDEHCLFMNTKNVRPDGFDFKTAMFITKEKDSALGNGKLQRGDVVMTTRGTIGNIGIYDDKVKHDNIRINSGMLIFRPNLKVVSSEYLFEMLRSGIMKSQIKKHVSGAAQPQLPIKTLVNFAIPVPKSLSEQKTIVKKLDALSEQTKKLEAIYKQKIADLDELKKSVLKSAFAGKL